MRSVKIILTLLICLFIPLAIGGISGYATASGLSEWYINLHKPSFNPPGYLFGPVWTLLYLLMGISLFIIWSSPKKQNRTNAIIIFSAQLALNFLWSFLFFKFKLVGLALLDIVLIWISILLMIISFNRASKVAAYLQIPYLLWVTFATTLNCAIWLLN